jgi:hypothetical protein
VSSWIGQDIASGPSLPTITLKCDRVVLCVLKGSAVCDVGYRVAGEEVMRGSSA